MNNYYKECLETLESLMEAGNLEEVNRILNQEMSLPYVPEPYYTTFLEMQSEIETSQVLNQKTLSFDEILERLYGNTEQRLHALNALESMNLHRYESQIQELLESNTLEDEVKKHILICCKEQKLDMTVEMKLQDRLVTITVSELEDPFTNPKYVEIYQLLSQEFETDNPSMFLISIEMLNGLIYEAFPFWNDGLSADQIIRDVNRYFGIGV